MLRIWAFDPLLGALPAHPQPLECGSDGFARDSLVCKSLLEADVRSVLQRPEAALCLPNSLGERCKSFRKASALSSSKAARTSLGREEPGVRDLRALWSNSWMASRTVCWAHPRFSAMRGAVSPRAL